MLKNFVRQIRKLKTQSYNVLFSIYDFSLQVSYLNIP